MARLGFVLTLASGFAVMSCSGAASIDDAAKTKIDCLASKTVMSIAETVREGTAAGLSPDDLAGVQADKTNDGLSTLEASDLGGEGAAYFEFETARRMNAMQAALRSGDQESEAFKTLTETRTLAGSCTFD